MMRALTFIILVLFLALPPSTFGEEALALKVERAFLSRKIVSTIHFSNGSSALSPEAKMEIDKIIPQLRKIDTDKSLLRIEGFASAGGGQDTNVPISMSRAKAVVDYIQSKSPLQADLFITGFGAQATSSTPNDQSNRAEIALYDNIWKMNDVAVEKVAQK